MIGILAARIRERFHRPVIAFAPGSDGELKGSGRSIPGLHLRDALDLVDKRHPGLLLRFGGHAAAAGLAIRAERVRALSRRVRRDPARAAHARRPRSSASKPTASWAHATSRCRWRSRSPTQSGDRAFRRPLSRAIPRSAISAWSAAATSSCAWPRSLPRQRFAPRGGAVRAGHAACRRRSSGVPARRERMERRPQRAARAGPCRARRCGGLTGCCRDPLRPALVRPKPGPVGGDNRNRSLAATSARPVAYSTAWYATIAYFSRRIGASELPDHGSRTHQRHGIRAGRPGSARRRAAEVSLTSMPSAAAWTR